MYAQQVCHQHLLGILQTTIFMIMGIWTFMLNVHVPKQKHNYILEQEVKHFDFQKAMHGPILISIKS